MDKPIAIVLHGGAGWFANLSNDQQAAIKDKMKEAMDAGYSILESGGTSGDAVIASITILEDSPLFNAGKGVTKFWQKNGANNIFKCVNF